MESYDGYSMVITPYLGILFVGFKSNLQSDSTYELRSSGVTFAAVKLPTVIVNSELLFPKSTGNLDYVEANDCTYVVNLNSPQPPAVDSGASTSPMVNFSN